MKTLLIGINSKYIHPAMGIFQLVANSHYPVNYREFTTKDTIESMIDFINNDESELVGFSVYIWNINYVMKIIPCIKNKTIFVGGPEASHNPKLFFTTKVKYIIKGEGEESFNELLAFLSNETTDINSVSNIYYKKDELDNSSIEFTYSKLPDLNHVIHDYSLIKDYHNRVCYVESSRGCYFNCSYCLASTEKPVRFFPIEEVKANLLFLLNNNARIIKFLDRSFNINKNYMIDILSFIKEHDNNISQIQFEIVGDKFDDEVINLLNSMRKKMIRLEIGIQTTNPEVTKEILRKQDFSKLRDNILLIRDNVVIHTDLIAGLPLETFESFKKSFNETFELFTEELQLGFLKELKGTHISKTKENYGYIFDNTSPYEVISNNHISKEELDKVRLIEKSLDKLYNSGNFPRVMNYIFRELSLNPWEIFTSVSLNLERVGPLNTIQFPEVAKIFYQSLIPYVQEKKDKLLYIFKMDYLTKGKVKQKIWWEQTITRTERKRVYEALSNKYSLSINELYGYGHLEKLDNMYFVINYFDHKIYELVLDN